MATRYSFGSFTLDTAERRLEKDGEAITLSSRYLDALALMLREPGALVTKERFHEEVWKGVPVTDEALTQCIRSLRKALGDDAANPRFIETVPKHGYRFVGQVDEAGTAGPVVATHSRSQGSALVPTVIAYAVGGLLAGLAGGLFYGLVGTSGPVAESVGGASTMLVLLSLCGLVGTIAGLLVGTGVGLAGMIAGSPRGLLLIVGGAIGGLVAGALGRLVGLDGFGLLVGKAPGNITGAPEGLAMGLAAGYAAWWLARRDRVTPAMAMALGGFAGLVGGLVIVLAGGNLMLGSLAELAAQFPQSRLDLSRIGGLLGESNIGPLAHGVFTALEGALFAGAVTGAAAKLQRNKP